MSEEKGREVIERLEATLQSDGPDHFLIAANEGRLRAILSRSGGGVPAVEAAVNRQLGGEADSDRRPHRHQPQPGGDVGPDRSDPPVDLVPRAVDGL